MIKNYKKKENFTEKLKERNSASQSYIANFVKNTDFDKKLRKNNDKVTLNKARHVEAEKKLNDQINSDTKLRNDLSREVKLISTKGLTKDLVNGFRDLENSQEYVYSAPPPPHLPALKNTTTSFLPIPLLNLQTVQVPLFRQPPPRILVFREHLPL